MSVSRFEIIAWVGALAVVGVMAFITFHGPFNRINKPPPPLIVANLPAAHATIRTDPRTVGAYVPTGLTVHVGQKVVFLNDSSAPHTVTAKGGVFDSGDIAIGTTWAILPQKTGVFQYYCKYHPLMTGVLVVTK